MTVKTALGPITSVDDFSSSSSPNSLAGVGRNSGKTSYIHIYVNYDMALKTQYTSKDNFALVQYCIKLQRLKKPSVRQATLYCTVHLRQYND